VLSDKSILAKSQPVFCLLADRSRIAYVEVAPEGKYSIKVIDDGILFHTNHYLDLPFANQRKPGKSSETRLSRIQHLLRAQDNTPFTMAAFILFSKDQHDGPDDSIWRTG
jgi:isopenicillin-N N-acyltransferase-like protein